MNEVCVWEGGGSVVFFFFFPHALMRGEHLTLREFDPTTHHALVCTCFSPMPFADDDDEPTYAFSQPRNTSVRPRALRSMHGRTDRGSLDGSNI